MLFFAAYKVIIYIASVLKSLFDTSSYPRHCKNFPFNMTNPMTKKRSCRLLFDLKYEPFELGVYFWATSIANLSRSAPFGNAIADSRE